MPPIFSNGYSLFPSLFIPLIHVTRWDLAGDIVTIGSSRQLPRGAYQMPLRNMKL
ncbi:hypothetical protein IAD21_05121 [Abditibacteriota bacterium]|nr:hypothetical protein IAD21_05121 [Abditibacteriota bacterium]